MDSKEFEEIFESMVSNSRNLLVTKAAEYATGNDRLSNFKMAAAAQGITATQALRGMTTKHTVSINDMVWSGKDFPMDKWEEKIGDEFNYLILLMALIWEGKNEAAEVEVEEGDGYVPNYAKDSNPNATQMFVGRVFAEQDNENPGFYNTYSSATDKTYHVSGGKLIFDDGRTGWTDESIADAVRESEKNPDPRYDHQGELRTPTLVDPNLAVTYEKKGNPEDVPEWNGSDRDIQYPYPINVGHIQVKGFDNLRDLAAYLKITTSKLRRLYTGEVIDENTYYVTGTYYKEVI